MKNKLLSSSAFRRTMQNLLLVFLFLTAFASFSQSNKKHVVSQDLKSAVAQPLEKNPLNDLSAIKRDTPNVPANYTATKVSLSANASPEAKAEFLKKHNADHYYVYSDDKAKIVSKEEVEIALQLEQSKTITKTPIINPKK